MANLRLSTIPFYTTGELEKREILSKYIDTQDEFTGILELLEMMGQFEPTDNKEFFNYTQDKVFQSATVAGGSGNGISALAPAGTDTLTLTTGHGVRAQVGDFVVGPDGSVGYVKAISGDALTIQNPNPAGVNLTIADNAVVTFPTSGVAEGSNATEMAVSSVTKRSNQLQYFETYTEATDISLGSKIELDFNGVNHYFQLQSHLAFMKHRAKISNAFLVGKKVSAVDAAGGIVPMTKGLDSYITDSGSNHDASNATGPAYLDKADWRAFSRKLDAKKAPDEGHLWVGGDMSASLDDVFDGLLASGGVKYDAFGKGSSKAKAVDMGVQSFTIYDRTYHKKKLSAFENSGTTSAAGQAFPDTGYFVPSGQVGTMDGSSVSRIRGRYLNLPNGLSGRYLEIETGGLAETPTDRTAVLGYTHRSYEGLEITGPEHFGKIKLSA
jgi:hypothetical protein